MFQVSIQTEIIISVVICGICCFIGYRLYYKHSQDDEDIIRQLRMTISKKYNTNPIYKHDVYELRKAFTSKNKIYVSFSYDDNVFERAVKAKHKWFDWLELYDAFCNLDQDFNKFEQA